MCVYLCYTFCYISFYFLFSKTLVLGGGEGSYSILNSARTQRVVQPFCSVAFEIAHARLACGPYSSSDAASDTVAGKSPRKQHVTTLFLTGTMLPASEPPACVAHWVSDLLHSRWQEHYISAGSKNDVPTGLGCR
jgi:hypothetical protein